VGGGFAAPAGQRCALTTAAWTRCACPQFHKPQQQEKILSLTGMKEKNREYFYQKKTHSIEFSGKTLSSAQYS
jgi:hypothetical protein